MAAQRHRAEQIDHVPFDSPPDASQGVVASWNENRASVSITPNSTRETRVFVHVSAFLGASRGCEVAYAGTQDERNRPRASEVRYVAAPSAPCTGAGILALAAAALFFASSRPVVGKILLMFSWLLLLSSALAFFLYGADKSAAVQGTWRIAGPPLPHDRSAGSVAAGAFVARHVFRHKTVEEPFRTLFWSPVIFGNCVGTGRVPSPHLSRCREVAPGRSPPRATMQRRRLLHGAAAEPLPSSATGSLGPRGLQQRDDVLRPAIKASAARRPCRPRWRSRGVRDRQGAPGRHVPATSSCTSARSPSPWRCEWRRGHDSESSPRTDPGPAFRAPGPVRRPRRSPRGSLRRHPPGRPPRRASCRRAASLLVDLSVELLHVLVGNEYEKGARGSDRLRVAPRSSASPEGSRGSPRTILVCSGRCGPGPHVSGILHAAAVLRSGPCGAVPWRRAQAPGRDRRG